MVFNAGVPPKGFNAGGPPKVFNAGGLPKVCVFQEISQDHIWFPV